MSEGEKIGARAYDLNAWLARGRDELSNGVVFPDSHIPVRDYSGVYGAVERRDVEPSQPSSDVQGPEMEREEPELER